MATFRSREDAPGPEPALLWPDEHSGPWLIRVMLAPIKGRREPVGLEIRSYRGRDEAWPPELPVWDQNPPVLTTSVLRELPFATMIADLRRETAAGDIELYDRLEGQPGFHTEAERAELRQLKSAAAADLAAPRRNTTGLREVAAVYRQAWKGGRPPTQAVADHFTISQSAAAKRVSRARQAGYLPPTTRGRPGIT
jgi:hypothetical protein